MVVVNMHEAKSSLSKLVERAREGEEVVIARRGEPVARLVPEPPGRRRLGGWAGRVNLDSDWDSPETNAEIARLFNGDE